MAVLKIAAAIIAPAAFWIGYFYYKDRRRPEPLLNLIEAFLMGFLAGFFCFEFYGWLARAGISADFQTVLAGSTRVQFLSYSVVFIGLIEEIFKFLPFVLVILRLRTFEEPIDGIVYAASLAVGFASFENLGYLPYMSGPAFLGRAVASPLTHTVFSSIWGYVVGRAFVARRSIIPACLIGLGLAGFAHGLFNFLTFNHALRFLSALLVLAIWMWAIRAFEKRGKGGPKIIDEKK
jgi:protease PrsW